jgi:MHS family proline/betaine transporter-like MFS transporter
LDTAIFVDSVVVLVGDVRFDFAVFGAFADVIGAQFFPSTNPELELLKSLSVFGAAFAMRPLGGVVMGWIGDRFGRKRALEISIALMLVPSFLIGCLPTYQHAGILFLLA